MILSGILHTSLGGFTVIRGVAPLGELERCSEFNPKYQRNLIEKHKAEIERFLADREYLFFPEVILSASLQFDFNAYKGKRTINPVTDILSGISFTSNVNGLRVTPVNTKLPRAMEAVGAAKAPQLAYLELPENQLDNGLKLFRIDGNHRLSAVNNAKAGEAKYSLPTPFCIVLHDDGPQAQRFEKVVFHNINAKQVPLTSEENLRLILQTGEGSLFEDKVLLENSNFGPAYYMARKLLDEINERYLDGMEKHLENPRSLALSLTQFLISKNLIAEAKETAALDEEVSRLRKAFQTVNTIYQEQSDLAAGGCHGVLVAFLYFAVLNEGRHLPAFTRWVTRNRIDNLSPLTITEGLGYHSGRIQAVDSASLVGVFKSVINARHHEIFISMPFGDDTTENYETIKKTIRQINYRYKSDLRWTRIDQFNKGHSYTIDDEILEVIEGSGLLIADLTFGNKNVYHEVGYLMGLNRGMKRGQEKFHPYCGREPRRRE